MEESLLQDVKDYLNISYEDDMTDRMLTSAIKRGKAVLNDYAGRTLNYENEGGAKQLLLDYCRYVRSHATEMFEANYRRELISLRGLAEVEYYADQNASDG